MDAPDFQKLADDFPWSADEWKLAWWTAEAGMPARHHERFWGDLIKVVRWGGTISPNEIANMMIESYNKGRQQSWQARQN